MNNIKKAVFYIIFKSKSTIFNMLGVGVLGTLMLVVFQQDQFYSCLLYTSDAADEL